MIPGTRHGVPPKGLFPAGLGGGGGVGGGGVALVEKRNQLKPATEPPEPIESTARRSTFGPALSDTSFVVTVCHASHVPVSGTVIDPLRLTPSTSTWKLPPVTTCATRVS